MQFEFDPAKNATNLAKHGLSLADAPEFELLAAAVPVDSRYNYDEVRYRAFGRVDGKPCCLVFTVNADVIRVISYRHAHEKEMRRYE